MQLAKPDSPLETLPAIREQALLPTEKYIGQLAVSTGKNWPTSTFTKNLLYPQHCLNLFPWQYALTWYKVCAVIQMARQVHTCNGTRCCSKGRDGHNLIQLPPCYLFQWQHGSCSSVRKAFREKITLSQPIPVPWMDVRENLLLNDNFLMDFCMWYRHIPLVNRKGQTTVEARHSPYKLDCIAEFIRL